MQFKFTGNPHAIDNVGSVTVYGIYFPLNVAIDVTNPRAIKKLMGNHHFSICDGGAVFHQTPKLILPDSVAPPPALTPDIAAPAVFDIEAEIQRRVAEALAAQAAPSDEKERLITFAKEHGIAVDRRMSIETITQKIDDAAAAAEAAKLANPGE